MKVLIVEDNPKVARFLGQIFKEEGFANDFCVAVEDTIEHAAATVYDLMVVEWASDNMVGATVCRSLRRMGITTPILLVTARTSTRERVIGLDAGADDVMTRPFEVEELRARVRALLRRASGGGQLRCGELDVDRIQHRATLNGKTLDLSARELAILTALAMNADEVVTRTQLLSQVWSASFDTGSNVIDVHINRLRDKLGQHRWMIETVRGKGYRLRTRAAG